MQRFLQHEGASVSSRRGGHRSYW